MISRGCLLCLAAALAALPASRAQPSPPHPPADYSQEASVIEELSTKIAFDNDGNLTREQTSRVRVQTDAGVQQWGLLNFPFQSATQTVDIDYVRVRKPDGSTVATPPDNIQDLDSEITRSAPFYSDLREKHVAVKGLGKGDILEYGAHWQATKPLVPGQFWFQYSFHHEGIVLGERLEIKVPVGRAVKLKGQQATQTVTTDGDTRIYAWTYAKLENAKEPESDKKKVDAALGRLPAPDVQISSFQSWEDVGRWYWSLQKNRIEPTAAIRAKAAELTKGMTDDAAKLHILYSFVSTQYRYIGIAFGIGRYQPHAAEDVLTNNYGDCKDKHTLLASLLQASGIRLYPALISSGRILDPDVPSPAQFDHIIGYLPQVKEAVWLDTTPEVGPFGYLVPPLRDKQALVMSGDKSTQLVTTPADPPFLNSAVFKIDAKLSDNGTLDAKMERTDRGDTEVLLRSAFRSVGQPQWKELMQRISYSSGYAGTVSDVQASAPEMMVDPFHISYSYNRKDYPDWTNHHITAPPPAFVLPPVTEDDSKPKEPVWLGSPIEISAEARIELPKGYMPEMPADVTLKRDFAEYHAMYSHTGSVITVRRHLVTKAREVPVAELVDYKAFNKSMQDDANQYIETSSGTAMAMNQFQKGDELRKAIESLPDSVNTEANRLEKSALDAMKALDVTRAQSDLKSAVSKDPKFTRAWLRLAAVYAGLAATTDAIATYYNAVDSDPTTPICHRLLAFALMAANRSNEAIRAWQDLLKVMPDDGDAAANLGALLLQQKRFSEAVAYLETAEKKDGSPASQYRLGVAYLRAGQIERGTTILEKIVEADPKPETLNDVAYELADSGADLPKAIEYAQRAVNEQEKESDSVLLSSLLPDDLNCTQKIGNAWDTLGWAHFRLGHSHQAEDYLYAAWLLTQAPEVADHLGQVYEQERNTLKAIRMYRLVLSTGGPPGGLANETRRRLEHLTGGRAPTQLALLRSNVGSETSRLRSAKLPRIVPGYATAEFFLVFSPGPKVEDVQFIKGSETLKDADDKILAAHFQVAFPEGSSARLVRRAILSCSPASGCEAVLLTPNSVNSER
jgi:tetratricopeptide (TPR) repeat protein